MNIKLPKRVQSHLDDVLEESEKVVDIVKEPWSYAKWHRWTVLTDRRIIVLVRWPFGISHDVWPMYLGALSVDMNEGVIFDTIFVDYFAQKFRLQFFTKNRKRTVHFFREINRQLILHNPASRRKAASEVVEELESLAQVFHEKIITKEEYDRKKKDLMDKL